jgi:hypothetical protein
MIRIEKKEVPETLKYNDEVYLEPNEALHILDRGTWYRMSSAVAFKVTKKD